MGDETRRAYDQVAERYAAEIGDELRGKPLDRALLDALAELAGSGPDTVSRAPVLDGSGRARPPPPR